MAKKTYWLTVSSFYDDGHACGEIFEQGEYDERPEDTCTETRRCDIYRTWWESYEDAYKYVTDIRNGNF